ncbi:MAG: NAD-dependent epimerase/dehydratase family protein, partial [Methylobacterium sp.]
MKVIILGGDGFCGWATSLHLSAEGHAVTIVDNLVRRRTDVELGAESLTPIRPIEERLQAWRETRNTPIDFVELDVAKDYDRLEQLFREVQPDAIVHFAEQRA